MTRADEHVPPAPAAIAASLARHPRHLCLAALVAGLLAPSIGPAFLVVAAAALMLAARSAPVVAAITVLAVTGAAVAVWRLEATAPTRAGPLIGKRVTGMATVLEPARARVGGARSLRVRWHGALAPLDGAVLVARVRRFSRWPGGVPVGAVVRVEARVATLSLAERHQARRGAIAMLEVIAATDTGRRRGGVSGGLDAIRSRAERGLAAGLSPADAALARGLVLGQDERIAEHVREDFRRSGLAHVLAVSGQNVMLLALLALVAGTALGLPLRARLGAALALVALYVPLAGGGPSIQRAGVMGGAGLVAALAGRPGSRWYALGLAAAATLALNPRAAGDPGWQLSFAAVVALLALAGPLVAALTRRQWPRPLAEAFALTVSATLGTAPLLAYHFGELSLVSLPANLLAAPLVAPLMWLGMLAATAGQVSAGAAEPFTLAAEPLLRALQALAHAAAAVPGASAPVRIGSATGVVIAYIALAAACAGIAWWTRRRAASGPASAARSRSGRRTLVAALALALCALPLALPAVGAERSRPVAPDELVVSFLDVGQGNATLVQQGGVSMLVDTGPDPQRLRRALDVAGVDRLDLLLLTHASLDHDAGAVELLRRRRTPLLLDGGSSTDTAARRAIVAAAGVARVRRIATVAGQSWRLGRALVRVIWPRQAGMHAYDANDGATVLLVSFGDFDVLLPADAESNITARLPLPPLDALLVAHHGSADPLLPRLLARARPGVAVISVGAHNTYGHPNRATLAALRHVPRLYRTDRDGTVRLRVRGGRMQIETTRG